MNAPKQVRIRIADLANQLIHSYVFYLTIDETGPFRGILVASDHTRNRELLEVSSRDIIKIFDRAARGESHRAISVTYDEKREDYVVLLARRQRSRTNQSFEILSKGQ